MNDAQTTLTEALEMIGAEKQRRTQEASRSIQESLTKYNCDLLAVPQIAPDGRIIAVVQIFAR